MYCLMDKLNSKILGRYSSRRLYARADICNIKNKKFRNMKKIVIKNS